MTVKPQFVWNKKIKRWRLKGTGTPWFFDDIHPTAVDGVFTLTNYGLWNGNVLLGSVGDIDALLEEEEKK